MRRGSKFDMRRSHIAAFSVIAFFAGPLGLEAAQQISEDRELIEFDLTAWNCIKRPGGSARSPETIERNMLKNRWATDLAGLAVKSFDIAGFLKHVADFDAETKGKRRRDLNPDERRRLEILEAPIVSLTGYLGLAYAGPPETCNCSSVDFHDWHLEIFEEPPDHPPQPGIRHLSFARSRRVRRIRFFMTASGFRSLQHFSGDQMWPMNRRDTKRTRSD
jgi:hypothetical protein